MPELPEVETTCRDLVSGGIVGEKIESLELLWEPTLSNFKGEELLNATISGVSRRGKFILLPLSNGKTLLIHLRMTGSLRYTHKSAPSDPYDRVTLLFKDNKLAFRDPRKFGRMTLTAKPELITNKLGVEPLGDNFTPQLLHQMLQGRRKVIKTLLLDQSFIAGIGNIYADESLFKAQIAPLRSADSITQEEATKLHAAIVTLLSSAIANRGTSLGDGKGNYLSNGKRGENASELKIFRKTGAPCPVCATPIERIVVGQRGTHYCPTCQKSGRRMSP